VEKISLSTCSRWPCWRSSGWGTPRLLSPVLELGVLIPRCRDFESSWRWLRLRGQWLSGIPRALEGFS